DATIRAGERQQRRQVGRRARVRLHVGSFGAEQLHGAGASQLFDAIGNLATAIVSARWVALGVLVSEAAVASLSDGRRAVVLGSDQSQRRALTLVLSLQPR